MFNVKNPNTGEIIQLDFDTMTDKQLEDLENLVFTYRRERKELEIKKATKAIIDFIEAEMKNYPGLKDRTAIITAEDEYLDWSDLLNLIKDTYA